MDFEHTQKLIARLDWITSALQRIANALEAIAPKPKPEQTTPEEEVKE